MTRRERIVYGNLASTAMVLTLLPLIIQVSRFTESRWLTNAAEVAFIPTFISLPAMPLLIIAGIAYSLIVRWRMASRPGGPKRKPSALLFMVCGVAWPLFLYSFRLVPLFLSENSVRRGFVDDWLDLLL
ncbi:MAG: hypothetical protein AMXMBFR82_49810 [Candidatus Hydrogenedentota bacterium]